MKKTIIGLILVVGSLPAFSSCKIAFSYINTKGAYYVDSTNLGNTAKILASKGFDLIENIETADFTIESIRRSETITYNINNSHIPGAADYLLKHRSGFTKKYSSVPRGYMNHTYIHKENQKIRKMMADSKDIKEYKELERKLDPTKDKVVSSRTLHEAIALALDTCPDLYSKH